MAKPEALINFLNDFRREESTAPLTYDNHFLSSVKNTRPAVEAENMWGYEVIVAEVARRYYPLYLFLTQPRSITEFKELRQAVCKFIVGSLIKSGGDDLFAEGILIPMARDLFIIPDCDSAFQVIGGIEVPYFVKRGQRRTNLFNPEKKICGSWKEVLKRIISHRRYSSIPEPVCLLGGKWRLGPHSEQRKTILNAANTMKEVGGVIVISVESNEAIRIRRNQEAPPLQERMGWVAALPGGDIVFPADPQSTDPAKISEYYESIWKNLGINFYVIGEKNHEYFNMFAERAKKVGAILLWDHEMGNVSASQLLRTLQ